MPKKGVFDLSIWFWIGILVFLIVLLLLYSFQEQIFGSIKPELKIGGGEFSQYEETSYQLTPTHKSLHYRGYDFEF